MTLMCFNVSGHRCFQPIRQQFGVNTVGLIAHMMWMNSFLRFCLSPSSSVTPALGLAWANQVMVRLLMRRLQATIHHNNESSTLRRLEVVFAPHLARDGQVAAVWKEGVRGVLNSD